jgi:hypothetical protein
MQAAMRPINISAPLFVQLFVRMGVFWTGIFSQDGLDLLPDENAGAAPKRVLTG